MKKTALALAVLISLSGTGFAADPKLEGATNPGTSTPITPADRSGAAVKAVSGIGVMSAITGLSIPDVINPSKPYAIKLLGHGQCSFHVEYGDNTKENLDKMLPFTFDHGYLINSSEIKTFKLKVSAFGNKCSGSADAAVTVAGPGVAAPQNNTAIGATTGTAASTNSKLKVACPPGKAC